MWKFYENGRSSEKLILVETTDIGKSRKIEGEFHISSKNYTSRLLPFLLHCFHTYSIRAGNDEISGKRRSATTGYPHCQVSQTSVKLHGVEQFYFSTPFAISLTTPPSFTLFTSFPFLNLLVFFLSLSLLLVFLLSPRRLVVSFSAFVEVCLASRFAPGFHPF